MQGCEYDASSTFTVRRSSLTTADLIREIRIALCVPVPQLRAHWGDLGPRIIQHLEKQDAELTAREDHE